MPQAANITINDRESTPVAHIFTPSGVKDQVATFVNLNATMITARERLSLSWRTNAGKHKVRLVLMAPVVATETINGVSVPKQLRVGFADLTLTFADTSTLQERKNIVGLLANALASSQAVVDPVLTNVEGLY